MEKKNYQKPSMLVIKMERTGVLMDSGSPRTSSVSATRSGYGEATGQYKQDWE